MSIVLFVHVAAFQKLIKSSAKCVHSFLISIKTRCTLHFQRRGAGAVHAESDFVTSVTPIKFRAPFSTSPQNINTVFIYTHDAREREKLH